MQPLVTILIPTYNQENYILQAVNSCLSQTYPNLEVIVLDDCSSDDTLKQIVDFEDKRLKIFKNEKNLGRVANYYNGLYHHAKGEWFVNLDGDDYFIDNEFIERSIHNIGENSDIVMIQSLIVHSKYLQSIDKIEQSGVITFLSGKQYFLEYYATDNFSHLASMYRTNASKQSGFYQANHISSDAVSTLQLMAKGNVLLINKIVGVWRIHGTNTSLTSNIGAFISNMQQILSIGDFHFKDSFITLQEKQKWQSKMYVQYMTPLIIRSLLRFDLKSVRQLLNHSFDTENTHTILNLYLVKYLYLKFIKNLKRRSYA